MQDYTKKCVHPVRLPRDCHILTVSEPLKVIEMLSFYCQIKWCVIFLLVAKMFA